MRLRRLSCVGACLLLIAICLLKRPDHTRNLRVIPFGVMYARSADGYAIRITPTKWKIFHITDRTDPAHPVDWLSLGPLQLYRVPTNTEFH